jgi:hypothetical protein
MPLERAIAPAAPPLPMPPVSTPSIATDLVPHVSAWVTNDPTPSECAAVVPTRSLLAQRPLCVLLPDATP